MKNTLEKKLFLTNKKEKIYLGLGSNLFNPKKQIINALNLIEKIKHTKILYRSSLIETEPLGIINQPNFINTVCLIETQYFPYKLLNYLQNIEKKLGRRKFVINGPRIIDIDILKYKSNISYKNIKKFIVIPHPELNNRIFFLNGINEIENMIKINKGKKHGFTY